MCLAEVAATAPPGTQCLSAAPATTPAAGAAIRGRGALCAWLQRYRAPPPCASSHEAASRSRLLPATHAHSLSGGGMAAGAHYGRGDKGANTATKLVSVAVRRQRVNGRGRRVTLVSDSVIRRAGGSSSHHLICASRRLDNQSSVEQCSTTAIVRFECRTNNACEVALQLDGSQGTDVVYKIGSAGKPGVRPCPPHG